MDDFVDNENIQIINELNNYNTLNQTRKNAIKNRKRIDLVGMDLHSIPDNIKYCKSLKSLNISYNPNLTELPVSLKELNNLTHFLANNCGLLEIPKFLGKINGQNLLQVELNSNHIGYINKTLLNLNANVYINLENQTPLNTDVIKVDKRVLKKFKRLYGLKSHNGYSIEIIDVEKMEKEKELVDTVSDNIRLNKIGKNSAIGNRCANMGSDRRQILGRCHP